MDAVFFLLFIYISVLERCQVDCWIIFFDFDFFLLEPRCGPMTGASAGEMAPMQSSISPAMSESDLPQPLVVRSPSVSLKWPADNGTKTSPSSPNRQVNN